MLPANLRANQVASGRASGSRNHVEYVSAVAHAAVEFLAEGLISEDEADEIYPKRRNPVVVSGKGSGESVRH